MRFALLLTSALIFFKSNAQDTLQHKGISFDCLYTVKEKRPIINSVENFKKLSSQQITPYNCPELYQIDFSTNMLIGYSFSAGGCKKPDLDLQIIRLEGDKYSIKCTEINYGICKVSWYETYWFLVSTSINKSNFSFEVTSILAKD